MTCLTLCRSAHFVGPEDMACTAELFAAALRLVVAVAPSTAAAEMPITASTTASVRTLPFIDPSLVGFPWIRGEPKRPGSRRPIAVTASIPGSLWMDEAHALVHLLERGHRNLAGLGGALR